MTQCLPQEGIRFWRLAYMERQGSGLNKIRGAYENAANYREGMEPVFYSDRVMLMVTLKNLNYKMLINEAENEAESEDKSEAKNIALAELERKFKNNAVRDTKTIKPFQK